MEHTPLHLSQPATRTHCVQATDQIMAFCEALAAAHQLSSDFTYQVVSAFQEAYNNVIEHAYQGQEGHPVEIIASTNGEQLILSLCDAGLPTEREPQPLDLGHCDVAQLPEGGMGLAIIAAAMDDLLRCSHEGHNWLIMIKQLDATL